MCSGLFDILGYHVLEKLEVSCHHGPDSACTRSYSTNDIVHNTTTTTITTTTAIM
jgi:hypothetical protein